MVDYDLALCYGIVVSDDKIQELKEALTDEEYDEMMENYSRCINSWTGDDYFIGIIDYFSESETSFVYHVSTFSVPSDEELISFNDFFDEHDLWRFVDWKPNLLLINFCY